ncbi:hypothetical protein [Deinococcus sp. QL22]|uniref:hypothetical protein n=1 Tax=Deinococcus sp. QL22 TaxID=2939437 RepID=UPI002018159F|nr:hypothetical protein [Deinococcus sp. QL22]UQN10401.1 hypothetical protein M1R55_30065 [Deinococcus sp. QL22]UQN10535.1 hypothetical protein M1R55_29390 [Deinococcus sp. QL22]
MRELAGEFRVGRLTPPEQKITLTNADLSPEDLAALLKASREDAKVLLKTEAGRWLFLVVESSHKVRPSGSSYHFSLISSGNPGA